MFQAGFCEICCDELRQAARLDCDCKVCMPCLKLYIEVKINETFDLNQMNFKCPGYCNKVLDKEEIQSVVSQNHFTDEWEQSILVRFLQEQKDIRPCPNNSCFYYGFLPSKPCLNKLECDKCATQWNCPELLPWVDHFIESLNNKSQTQSEVMSLGYEFFCTKQCPNCLIQIDKIGGCYHMTCQKCQFEFCWHCKQSYHDHQPLKCLIHCVIKYGTILNILFNLLVIYEIHGLIYSTIMSLFLLFLNFTICNSISWVFLNVCTLSIEYRVSQNKKQLKEKLIANLFLFFVMILVGKVLVNLSGWSFFQFMIIELVFSILSFIMYLIGKTFFKYFVKRWINYVK